MNRCVMEIQSILLEEQKKIHCEVNREFKEKIKMLIKEKFKKENGAFCEDFQVYVDMIENKFAEEFKIFK